MGYKKFFAVLIIYCVIGCSNNENPVIEAITFIPEIILAGESCIVTCTAVDQDNDKLSYEWETIGNIARDSSGDGSSVFYTPNSCCGAPEIIVTVKDGRGGRADSQFTVPFQYDVYE